MFVWLNPFGRSRLSASSRSRAIRSRISGVEVPLAVQLRDMHPIAPRYSVVDVNRMKTVANSCEKQSGGAGCAILDPIP